MHAPTRAVLVVLGHFTSAGTTQGLLGTCQRYWVGQHMQEEWHVRVCHTVSSGTRRGLKLASRLHVSSHRKRHVGKGMLEAEAGEPCHDPVWMPAVLLQTSCLVMLRDDAG